MPNETRKVLEAAYARPGIARGPGKNRAKKMFHVKQRRKDENVWNRYLHSPGLRTR